MYTSIIVLFLSQVHDVVSLVDLIVWIVVSLLLLFFQYFQGVVGYYVG